MFFREFSVWTLGGVVIGYILYNSILAPIITGSVRYNTKYRIFITATIWTIYEYLKSSGFLGYPWGLVAYPVHTILPLSQIVDITGIWGLSFLMSMANATIAELILHIRDNSIKRLTSNKSFNLQVVFILIIFLIVTGYGFYQLKEFSTMKKINTKQVSILLVQQNTDPWKSDRGEKSILTNQKLSKEAIKERKKYPDIIVWSESSLTYPAVGYRNIYDRFPKKTPLIPFIKKTSTYLLTGGPVLLPPKNDMEIRAMNSAILFNPRGKVIKYYGKQHPVPFAESIPFWEFKSVRTLFRKLIGIENVWVMGKQYTLFNINLKNGEKFTFSTPICFEDAFPYLNREFTKRGAEAFINITNDSWSKTVSAETQHFVAAKFRAIENRRYLLRSTTAGVTAIVSPSGKVIQRLPLFKEGYLNAKINIPHKLPLTIYTRLGDYFPVILIVFYLLFIIQSAYKTYHSHYVFPRYHHKQ